MARSPRLDEPGARHHVMNRGARKQAIFPDDDACARFLMLLGQLPGRFGVRVHGYALMPNHFHLLLECPSGGLDQAMQFLQSRYSRWLNRTRGWDGPLYRGRYRNRVVEDEPYWAHLLAYLHLNPVRAHLVSEAAQAHWTSHEAYVGSVERPSWLTTSEILDIFGSLQSYKDYLWDVQVGREEGPPGFHPDRLWRTATSAPEPVLPRPRPRNLFSIDNAWVALSTVTGMSKEQLLARPDSVRGEPARWMAMAWLPKATGLTRRRIADEFGVGPAVVSRSAKRYRGLLGFDERITTWTERLDSLLEEPDEP